MIRKQKDSLRRMPQAVFFIQKWAMRKKEPVKKRENTYLPILLIGIPCYNAPSFQKERKETSP